MVKLQIDKVPEPVRMALGLLGGLAVLWFALGLCWKKPQPVKDESEAPESRNHKAQ